MDALQETREIKSFLSFLHLVLVKIFRDREEKVQCFIPDDQLGYDLMITIERAHPQIPDLYLEPEHLTHAVTHPPSEDEIKKLVGE